MAGHAAIVLLAAVALALLGDDLALATVTNVIPFNGQQDPMVGDTIPDDEEVWAYVTAPTGGVVCIHKPSPHPAGCRDGGAYSETPVTPFFAGIIAVRAGNLRSGEWIMVGAEGNGEPATTWSDSFFVEPCTVCGLDPPSKGAEFAAAANAMLDSVNQVCGYVKAASMLWRTRKLYEETQIAISSFSGGLSTGAVMTTVVGFGNAARDISNGDDLTAKLPGKLSTIADTLCDAAEKIQKAKESTAGHYIGLWAADPPDPDFTALARPDVTDFEAIAGMPDWGFNAPRQALDEVRAYAEAGLHDYERFQGAAAATAPIYEHTQARLMGDDLLGYAQSLRRSASFLAGTATQLRAEIPDVADRTVLQSDLDKANAFIDRVSTTGYTAPEIDQMHALGLTDAMIDRFKIGETLYDPSSVSPGVFDASLDTLAMRMRESADLAEAFSDEAAVYAGRSSGAPAAGFVATPGGPEGRDVQFADTSTDADHDPLTVSWDFGDGEGATTASGAPIAHHYASDATFVVNQYVHNDYGSDTVSHDVTTGKPSQPPVASFTATPQQGTAPLEVTLDASASSDPENGILTYEWRLGDGAEDAGQQIIHTYQSADPSVTVRLTVTDDTGLTAVATKTIVVQAPPQPPSTGADAMEARPVGTLDVLADDEDPDGDAFTVVATGAPAHGTVTCSALGACVYTASAGYAGADEFTYTVRDATGLENTGTVNVTVSAPPDIGEPVGADDETATRDGVAVNADVLANDSGKGPLTVLATTPPEHGTADCTPEGVCTYTPDAGFSGSDGFRYRLGDAQLHSATADVHVAVAPAASAFAVTVDGAPGALTSGDQATWSVGVTGNVPPGLPALSTQVTGPHALAGGTTTVAHGWTAAGAGPDALLGEAITEPISRPVPPVSQGVGGDGYVPILVGNRVYAFFHAASPTSMSCIDRATGALCPGYPVSLGAGAGLLPGPGVVIGTRIYLHLQPAATYAQRASIALFCFDTADARPCGLFILDRIRGKTNPGASFPVLVAGKLYLASGTGKLYCFDPAAGTACGTLPTGLADDYDTQLDVLAQGTRIFVSALDAGHVACVDVATAGSCSGWTLPKASAYWNLVSQRSAGGALTGVCVVAADAGDCWSDASPATRSTLTGWPDVESYWNVTQEAEVGTRIFQGSYPTSGIACWDWATMARCSGFGADGWTHKDSQDVDLPTAYGVQYDGSCLVALGDPGLAFTMTTNGRSPCTRLPDTRLLDLRDQRCDATVGGATWGAVTLQDQGAGELTSVRVEIRDAATGELLATKNLLDGTLGLGAIDAVAHPAVRIGVAVISPADSHAWDDVIPPRVKLTWHADPRQLCFKTATQRHCDPPFAPIAVSATVGAATAEKSLTVTRPVDCVDATPTASPTASPTAEPTASPAPLPTAVPTAVPTVAPPASGDLVLACSDRRVVLEDVFADGSKVRLLGVADRRFAGQTVTLTFLATRKVVATVKVGTDGHFAATAPLPPARLRSSSAARYEAAIGTEKSLKLKLARRMLIRSVTAAAGKVTIAGRVIGPLAAKASDRAITLQRIVACTRAETVSIFKPKANGAFTVTVAAPAGQKAAVYRLSTKVRATARSKKPIATFTLPRAVDFR
jgi:PKD repeat protein